MVLQHNKEKKKRERKTKDCYYFSHIVLFQELCTDFYGDTSRKLLYKETWEQMANFSFHFIFHFDKRKYNATPEILAETEFTLLFALLPGLFGVHIRKQNFRKYNGFHGSKNV